MAVPAGPQIKLSDVASEFSDTAPFQMSEFYRGGAKVPNVPGNAAVAASGALGLQSFKGTQNRVTVPLTISSSTTNYDVYTQASPSPNYTAGTTDIELTINSGVVVSSTSTGTYALNVPNAFTAGDTVKIINNGTVQGRGGNGGVGGHSSPGGSGGSGGNAVYVNFPTTIDNVGSLTGGGGGGGGGGRGSIFTSGGNPKQPAYWATHPGGGGGGGSGTPGGSGAAGGPSGSPGGAGNANSGGSGGSGSNPYGGNGGAGGGRGAAGGGGGAGRPGGASTPAGAGGAAGSYLVGNPLVTFETTGTRQGSVS